jgi:hypothetical protein
MASPPKMLGVVITLPVKNADFEPLVDNDAAIALGEIRNFSDEYFRHIS